jgi:molybdopterin molybdotransferase
MLSVAEARQRILANLPPLPRESVPLALAEKRIPTNDVVAPIPLPPFDNSAMDGYAVRAADVAAATVENPVGLRVLGKTPAGRAADHEVSAGTCVRLFTGSPMPRGADAVVMQEDCRSDTSTPDRVLVLDAVKPWENVRFAGEDVKAGTVVALRGEPLGLGHLSLLAALGLADVECHRRPRVGLLATGDELREPGEPLTPGQVFESNRLGLALLAQRAGALVTTYPIVRDTLEATQRALVTALDENDVVVSAGGVSVGELDFVKDAFTQTGGRLEFWRVALKPGKPLAFGRRGNALFFGLPGNPVSALVGFTLFVAPTLAALQGHAFPEPRTRSGVLEELLSNPGDRPHFLRVRTTASGGIVSSGIQASHILSALTGADGLVEVPPQTTLPAGSRVSVIDWR